SLKSFTDAPSTLSLMAGHSPWIERLQDGEVERTLCPDRIALWSAQMSETIRFEDKVVIVTGAGGGLGRAHALLFARHRARFVVCGLGGSARGEGASSSAADQVAEETRQARGTAVPNHDPGTDGEKIVQQALYSFGRMDV